MPSTQKSASDSRLLYLISHGLRSPMTSIRWGLGALQKGKVGELNMNQKELLGDLHERIREASIILRSMLNLSRLQQQSYNPKHEEVEIVVMLNKLIKDYGVRMGREHTSFVLHSNGEIHVDSDENLLYEVLFCILMTVELVAQGEVVTIDTSLKENTACVLCTGPLNNLPILSQYGQFHDDADTQNDEKGLVGGSQGLLLYLARNLARNIGADVILHGNLTDEECKIEVRVPMN